MATVTFTCVTKDGYEIQIWSDGDLTHDGKAIGKLISPLFLNLRVARLMKEDIPQTLLQDLRKLRQCALRTTSENKRHDDAWALLRMRGLMSRAKKPSSVSVPA